MFIKLVKPLSQPQSKVLFLGYSEFETSLIEELIKHNCEVWHTNQPVDDVKNYDLIISYGYRHILKKNTIKNSLNPIINLHISYLPWNRGAHPNFWSFYDGTPSGVTIHLIDEGIDTGNIIYQKKVAFSKYENTFARTFLKLRNEIENLFKNHIDEIISKKFTATPQSHHGTYHSKNDMPKNFDGWDSKIHAQIAKLKKQG